MALFEEQRICIKFCFKVEISSTQTHKMLEKAFGEHSLSYSKTCKWYSRFKNGRESFKDDKHTGRPISKHSNENVQKIKGLIQENRRMTISQLSLKTDLSVGLCHQIISCDLNMTRSSSKFVPIILTEEQKEMRLRNCENMIEMTNNDPGWMDKIITGDETWIYGYDPETKRQSSQWIVRGEPRPKKARMTKSKIKSLLVTFFDFKGIVHQEFIPEGRTVNQEVYIVILRNLREAIRQKRPEKRAGKNWILPHDNARPHTAISVLQYIAKNSTVLLPQPPYSPELAPNDFFLYQKLNLSLKGRHFESIETVQKESRKFLKSLKPDDFRKAFENWKKLWLRCINAEGAYFEKY